jgi:collagenase-like PrtC family protease
VTACFIEAGITRYRIELVDEPADDVSGIVEAYRAALSGRLKPDALRERLGRVRDANGSRQGVGLGSLAVRVEPPRDSMKKPTAR